MTKRIVVLTGAGVSAESGIPTFRDKGGLWEGYDIQDVATPEAFEKDPETVLKFYNDRRKAVTEVSPNEGHKALVNLEKAYDVHVITQNIDDLHERAGSSQVHHLHGEIKKARSSVDDSLIYEIGDKPIQMGDQCEKGSQLRPHVVWFGEPVPMIEKAMQLCSEADLALIIGTSLVVYPAAGLIDFVPDEAPKFYIDPNADKSMAQNNLEVIQKSATEGVPPLVERLLDENSHLSS